MKPGKSRFAALLIGIALLPFALRAAGHSQAAEAVSPDEALRLLRTDNDRYVHDRLAPKRYPAERRATAKGQHPFAVVLACADSRVAPEILFDESLGRLFVVRVAGNVVDPVVLGSVEYAAEHLHTRLIVVLGHEGCGAVQATIDGGTPSPDIAELTKRIAPAVEKTKGRGMEAAVAENVRLQVERSVAESSVLAEMAGKKEIRIVGAVYHLESGVVEWLDAK